jgi:hypothetical protein
VRYSCGGGGGLGGGGGRRRGASAFVSVRESACVGVGDRERERECVCGCVLVCVDVGSRRRVGDGSVCLIVTLRMGLCKYVRKNPETVGWGGGLTMKNAHEE